MPHKQSGRRICAVDGPRPTDPDQDWYLGGGKKKEKEMKLFFEALIWESSPPALCVITRGVSEMCFQCICKGSSDSLCGGAASAQSTVCGKHTVPSSGRDPQCTGQCLQ